MNPIPIRVSVKGPCRHSDSPPFRTVVSMGSEWGTLPRVRHSEWEGRHSEWRRAGIPNVLMPLFRNPGIPNVRYSEIPLFRNWLLRQFCPWILHQLPTSSTSNERWESPLHHPIIYSLFFFQKCIYSLRRNNVIPTGVGFFKSDLRQECNLRRLRHH